MTRASKLASLSYNPNTFYYLEYLIELLVPRYGNAIWKLHLQMLTSTSIYVFIQSPPPYDERPILLTNQPTNQPTNSPEIPTPRKCSTITYSPNDSRHQKTLPNINNNPTTAKNNNQDSCAVSQVTINQPPIILCRVTIKNHHPTTHKLCRVTIFAHRNI
jgi:hypothetical protein